MKKIVGIASIPSREQGLLRTIKDLSPQVDVIHIWLNGYKKEPPTEVNNVKYHLTDIDAGAVGKMKVLDFIDETEPFYFFTADDDIIYPSDYVDHNLTYYKAGTIQSSHGKIYKSFPIDNYSYGDISGYYFGSRIVDNKSIHVAGTGVALMDSTVANQVPYDKFLEYPNMLDVWMSTFCLINDIEMKIIPHDAGWLRPNPAIDQSDSIWETTKNEENQFRTSVFNYYIKDLTV